MNCKILLRKLSTLIIFFIICHQNIYAQCTVSILGDTCINGFLTAKTTIGVFKQLDWYHEGTLWYSAKPTGYNPVGATVAANISIPAGVCQDKNGNLYVSDLGTGSIIKFAPGSATGTVVLSGITDPNDLAIYNDTIYIACINNPGIYKWTIGAPTATKIVSLRDGFSAWGVCVDKKNNVYFTVNGFASSVYRLKPGSTEPQSVASSKKNGFGYALDVQVNKNGVLFIASENTVYKLAPEDSIATVVAGGNGTGGAENQLSFAVQILLDKQNNIFIADQDNHRIVKWAPGASSGLTILGGYAIVAGNPFILNQPRGLYIDSAGNLLASDIYSGSVISYSPMKSVYKSYITPATGNYTVVATDTSNCISTSNSVYVNTVPPIPASITGPVFVSAGQQNIVYSTSSVGAFSYTWSVPQSVTIVSGQGTNTITVNWGTKAGTLSVTAANNCGSSLAKTLKVKISAALTGSFAQDSKLKTNEQPLNIYPNPAKSNITVEHPASMHSAFIKLTDMTGKLIKVISIQYNVSRTNINLAGLLKGNYTITWTNGTIMKNKLLVVE